MEDLQTPFDDGKSLKSAPLAMIGGAIVTRLMLPLSGDLFELPAETVVDNLLICAALHESASGTKRTSRPAQPVSAFGGKADIARTHSNVRFGSKADMRIAIPISVAKLRPSAKHRRVPPS